MLVKKRGGARPVDAGKARRGGRLERGDLLSSTLHRVPPFVFAATQTTGRRTKKS